MATERFPAMKAFLKWILEMFADVAQASALERTGTRRLLASLKEGIKGAANSPDDEAQTAECFFNIV